MGTIVDTIYTCFIGARSMLLPDAWANDVCTGATHKMSRGEDRNLAQSKREKMQSIKGLGATVLLPHP